MTNTADGLTIGENNFAVTDDDEYILHVDEDGKIASVSGIDSGSRIIDAGGAELILTSSAGNFTIDEKTFAIDGDDSVTFELSSDGAVEKISDVVGAVGGDFTTAININGNAATFIIADSKVVSVDGVSLIDGLNNAAVHATGNVTVNRANVDVTGDEIFNVIVSDSKTTELLNISIFCHIITRSKSYAAASLRRGRVDIRTGRIIAVAFPAVRRIG